MDAAAEAEARWRRQRRRPRQAAGAATLQSSASEFPQDESCALLPSRSFGGSVKSNCSQGEGEGVGGGVGEKATIKPKQHFEADEDAARVDWIWFQFVSCKAAATIFSALEVGGSVLPLLALLWFMYLHPSMTEVGCV